jgi:hypothetical protein
MENTQPSHFNTVHKEVNDLALMATENFVARCRVIDRLNESAISPLAKGKYIAGECTRYYFLQQSFGKPDKEVRVDCALSPTVKGGLRYTFKVNGKVTARHRVVSRLLEIGV